MASLPSEGEASPAKGCREATADRSSSICVRASSCIEGYVWMCSVSKIDRHRTLIHTSLMDRLRAAASSKLSHLPGRKLLHQRGHPGGAEPCLDQGLLNDGQ